MYKLEFFYYCEFHAVTNSLVKQFFSISKRLDQKMKQSLRAKLWAVSEKRPSNIGYEDRLPEDSYIILDEREALWLSKWLQLHINFNPKIAALQDRLVPLEIVPSLEAA